MNPWAMITAVDLSKNEGGRGDVGFVGGGVVSSASAGSSMGHECPRSFPPVFPSISNHGALGSAVSRSAMDLQQYDSNTFSLSDGDILVELGGGDLYDAGGPIFRCLHFSLPDPVELHDEHDERDGDGLGGDDSQGILWTTHTEYSNSSRRSTCGHDHRRREQRSFEGASHPAVFDRLVLDAGNDSCTTFFFVQAQHAVHLAAAQLAEAELW